MNDANYLDIAVFRKQAIEYLKEEAKIMHNWMIIKPKDKELYLCGWNWLLGNTT